MRTHARGVAAGLATVFLGTGLGLALANRPRAAGAWILGFVLAACALVVTPWVALVLVAIHLGSAVHAYLAGSRSEEPLRVLHWPVGAVIGGTILAALVIRGFVVEAFKIPSSAMYPTLHIGDHVFVDKLTPHWHAIERGEVIVFTYPCDHQRDYIKRVIGLGGDTIEVRCNVVYLNGKALPSTVVTADDTYEDYEERSGQWFKRSCSRYAEVIDGHRFETFHDADRPLRDQRAATATQGDARDFPMIDRPPPSCRNAEDSIGAVGETLGTFAESAPTATGTACSAQMHFIVPADTLFVLGDNRNNSNDSRVWGTVPIALVKGRLSGIWWSHGAHGIDLGRFGSVH